MDINGAAQIFISDFDVFVNLFILHLLEYALAEMITALDLLQENAERNIAINRYITAIASPHIVPFIHKR